MIKRLTRKIIMSEEDIIRVMLEGFKAMKFNTGDANPTSFAFSCTEKGTDIVISCVISTEEDIDCD